ncbi:MAG: protein-L-isoaspartate(D-aspartate) O-methyltransferase [Acidobacteria bacterium]|nr:MAG: protein-L-isoaspartate(D-aspartate) O-methyltransferase [Acidobacteriota bacterium]
MSRDYDFARARLVQSLRAGGIRDERVLAAIGAVPRHRFVSGSYLLSQAYGDYALPIGHQQTISQPWVVARMTELLDLGPEHKVLEIGTGSGYQTAILARLARFVFSMERIGDLARQAIARIRELGLTNVKIQVFDGTVGWSEVAPFDRILVTAAAAGRVPPPLVEQLRDGGVLVVPEGDRRRQHLVRYVKRGEEVEREVGESVVFVPLVGRHGYRPEDAVAER